MRASFLRVERLIIRGLTVALVVFAIACIFWIPFDQSKLLRPIPAGAAVISSHRNLGPRIEYLATNVFFKSFFDSDEAVSKKLKNNRGILRILASRLTIMAYVPDFDRSFGPVLAVSSWIGAWTPILRCALWIHPPEDIAPLGDYNGHRLWGYKKPVQFSGAASYFSFAINEGVFIGCLSRDRSGIARLMKYYDERRDSILNIRQFRLAEKAPAADQVWIRIDLPYAGRNEPFFAVCSLDALKDDYLSATIRFDPDVPLNDFSGLNRNPAEIVKTNACFPSIIALLPSEIAAQGLSGLAAPEWERVIRPMLAPLSAVSNNVCMLAVFTGDYGGKFGKEPFRIIVPTVLLALSGSRPKQTKADVLKFLDFINTRHRLGLILNSSLPPAGQCPVYAVESTSGALMKSMPVEDLPAFSFYNDWFLLASNSAGLRKLLLNFQTQAVLADDGNGWLKQRNIIRKNAFIRIDPAEGGKALRFMLMVSIIMLDEDGTNPSKQNTIKIIKAVRSWLEAIGGLKNCAAWLETEGGKSVVHLEIGRR